MTSVPFFFAPNSATVSLPEPLAFWPMQEGTGTTLNDAIGSLDMTVVSATWSTEGRNGTNCLAFADSQWAYVADPFYMETFTICAWIFPTTTNIQKSIISKRNNSSGVSAGLEFECYITSGNLFHFRKYNTSNAAIVLATSEATIPQNQWTHIAITTVGDGADSFVFVNGAQSGVGTQSGIMTDSPSVLQAGGRVANNDTRYFNGRMQEFRVYDSQLTASQISTIYNLPTP